MYVTLDVHTWLETRKQCGRVELTRIGNYILASSGDRRDFDQFRDSDFYKERPLLKTDLLIKFMKKECGRNEIKYCRKFGLDFVMNFPSSKFDDLCNWAHDVLGVPKIRIGQCKWSISKLNSVVPKTCIIHYA